MQVQVEAAEELVQKVPEAEEEQVAAEAQGLPERYHRPCPHQLAVEAACSLRVLVGPALDIEAVQVLLHPSRLRVQISSIHRPV